MCESISGSRGRGQCGSQMNFLIADYLPDILWRARALLTARNIQTNHSYGSFCTDAFMGEVGFTLAHGQHKLHMTTSLGAAQHLIAENRYDLVVIDHRLYGGPTAPLVASLLQQKSSQVVLTGFHRQAQVVAIARCLSPEKFLHSYFAADRVWAINKIPAGIAYEVTETANF